MKWSLFNKHKGFTLAELLIAVSVLGVMSTAVLTSSAHVLQASRDAKRLADMEAIENALAQFYLDEGFYPGENQTLKDRSQIWVRNEGVYIGVDDTTGTPAGFGGIDDALEKYMDVVPRDPLHDGTRFYYAYDPQHLESVDQNCMDDRDPSHPLHFSKIDGITDCDCSHFVRTGFANVSSAAFGFNRSESPATVEKLELGTCIGSNRNIDRFHYNKLMFPMPD